MGKNLRHKREVIGLTQEKLAEKADLNPRTVQKIEAGRLNVLITTVARLKKALDCTWDELLEK
jgi:transcriptional regulator with XRE-family HTH domain